MFLGIVYLFMCRISLGETIAVAAAISDESLMSYLIESKDAGALIKGVIFM